MNEPEISSKAASNPNRTRDHLANERTYLAWIRTAIALIGFGLVVVRLSWASSAKTSPLNSLTLGVSLSLVGLLAVLFANWHYFRVLRAIETESFQPSQRAISVASALVFLIGVGVLIYLLTIPPMSLQNTPLSALSTTTST